jgi:hypothetical protein
VQSRIPQAPGRKWTPPQAGWVKLNSDAGFCPRTGAASIGVVIRNDRGEVLLTAWNSLSRCGSAEEAEAEACLLGVRLTAEWIRQPTCVESDCSNLAKALGQEMEPRSSWAGILSEIKAAGNLLPACSFSHIHREGNQVAHLLAQKALRRKECVLMRHNMPPEIRTQVDTESARRVNYPLTCNPNVTD